VYAQTAAALADAARLLPNRVHPHAPDHRPRLVRHGGAPVRTFSFAPKDHLTLNEVPDAGSGWAVCMCCGAMGHGIDSCTRGCGRAAAAGGRFGGRRPRCWQPLCVPHRHGPLSVCCCCCCCCCGWVLGWGTRVTELGKGLGAQARGRCSSWRWCSMRCTRQCATASSRFFLPTLPAPMFSTGTSALHTVATHT
jgi:hypothetical protein